MRSDNPYESPEATPSPPKGTTTPKFRASHFLACAAAGAVLWPCFLWLLGKGPSREHLDTFTFYHGRALMFGAGAFMGAFNYALANWRWKRQAGSRARGGAG